MTALLNGNVLIALLVADHIHHEAAETWFISNSEQFASCPITQGSLIRFLMRRGNTSLTARILLADLVANSRHVFWPDSIDYGAVAMDGISGHAQVTDAYLAQLARYNGGRLASFDRALAATHPDAVDLIPAT